MVLFYQAFGEKNCNALWVLQHRMQAHCLCSDIKGVGGVLIHYRAQSSFVSTVCPAPVPNVTFLEAIYLINSR